MLISILLNWLICGILTASGVLTNDPNDPQYKTRTDARSDVIIGSPWFTFPYPGMFVLLLLNVFIIFFVESSGCVMLEQRHISVIIIYLKRFPFSLHWSNRAIFLHIARSQVHIARS